ncbi:DHCW motif cupin fold protein [Marinomonas epiphytica]
MEIKNMPFGTIDWQGVEKQTLKGESGFAYWRTKKLGDVSVHMVTYSAGYFSEQWSTSGHIAFCVNGEIQTLLKDGREITISSGMSQQLPDGDPYRFSSVEGATLFMVD